MIGLQTHQVARRPVNDGTAHLAVSSCELLLPVVQLQVTQAGCVRATVGTQT